jgi:ABC-2 type transport system ATP-binding protein
MISAKGISKSYDGKQALESISLGVEEGEVVGLIGPNGAGKSTVMQVLTGQLPRNSGEAQVLGQDPEDDPEGLRERLGILPEREDPPSFLTGNEYLHFVSDVRGADIDKERWVEMMELEGKMEKETRLLSKGERQKLMFIQALFHDPEALFIDEPMINLDPRIQERVKERISEYASGGGVVLLSTHVIPLAEELCDRAYVVEDGRTVEELSVADEDLSEVFSDQYNP